MSPSHGAGGRFAGELRCSEAAPAILATKTKFAYLLFDGPEEHVPAKRRVEQLISQSGLPGTFSFVKVPHCVTVAKKLELQTKGHEDFTIS